MCLKLPILFVSILITSCAVATDVDNVLFDEIRGYFDLPVVIEMCEDCPFREVRESILKGEFSEREFKEAFDVLRLNNAFLIRDRRLRFGSPMEETVGELGSGIQLGDALRGAFLEAGIVANTYARSALNAFSWNYDLGENATLRDLILAAAGTHQLDFLVIYPRWPQPASIDKGDRVRITDQEIVIDARYTLYYSFAPFVNSPIKEYQEDEPVARSAQPGGEFSDGRGDFGDEKAAYSVVNNNESAEQIGFEFRFVNFAILSSVALVGFAAGLLFKRIVKVKEER